MRTRSLHLALVVALLGSLLGATLVGPRAGAAPVAPHPASGRLAQDAEGNYPASVTVQGERFLFDRLVPLDRADFQRVDRQGKVTFYARTDTPPFEPLYALRSGRSKLGLARYLPTNVASPDTACPAEAVQVGPLTGGDATYAFANVETDISTDALEQIADAGGQAVYADPGAAQPAPELFVAADAGLLRFLITDASGLPTALPAEVPFGDAVYAFESDATDQLDPAALTKVGCVGPFPAYVTSDQTGAPADRIVVLVAGRYLDFPATGAMPSDQPADASSSPADATGATPGDAGTGDVAGTPGDAAGAAATPDQQGDESTISQADASTPADASPPADEASAPAGDTGSATSTLEVVDDLGDGGQPDGLPREIVVDGARYLFDRSVPLSRQDLTRVAQAGPVIAYATSQDGPFASLFLSIPNRSDDVLGRYLPEQLDTPETDCPSQAAAVGTLNAGDASYAFAGVESTISTDALQQVGDSNGQGVYADPDGAQPAPELFVEDASGLLRFVLLGDAGRPASLADSLAFAGARFDVAADVTGQIDVATLARAGCAGPFPVYSPQEQAGGPFADLYVAVGDRVFQFSGQGGSIEAASPAASPETATDTPAPTETATDTETAVPPTDTETAIATDTETPVPTETATLVPPTETETPVPTETATAVPTDTETAVPTETETAVPTDTPSPTDTPIPPTETATPVPTDTPVPPTETATAVPAPETATSVPPTEIVVPADVSTAAPTETPAVATETPAPATQAATRIPLTAAEANLPPTVQVENTTYVFNQVSVDVDVSTLIQVQVITVQNVDLTVYARQTVQGAAPELYCVAAGGQVVGQYVPAASAKPTPPPSLPPTVEVDNATYVFNEVDVDIDVQTLVQVQVVTIQNVEVTIYADQGVQGQPTRLFAVTPRGQVVGQYVESNLVVTLQPQPTAKPTVVVLQPPAVVPTLAPSVPSPAAVTVVPASRCAGDPGVLDARGLPAHLPNRIQLGGVAYAFVRAEAVADVGKLTPIRCVGPFEAASTDQADRAKVVYLRVAGGAVGQKVYRFEASLTFTVNIEVTGQTRAVSVGNQRYQLAQTWQPVVYGSLSVILFVEDPKNQAPATIYAVDVHTTVVGEVIGEYGQAGDGDQPSDAMAAAAKETGLNADLTVAGKRYVLVNVYAPVGTTSNGFLTLFSSAGEGTSDVLLGRDKRETGLFIFRVTQPAGG